MKESHDNPAEFTDLPKCNEPNKPILNAICNKSQQNNEKEDNISMVFVESQLNSRFQTKKKK